MTVPSGKCRWVHSIVVFMCAVPFLLLVLPPLASPPTRSEVLLATVRRSRADDTLHTPDTHRAGCRGVLLAGSGRVRLSQSQDSPGQSDHCSCSSCYLSTGP